MSRDQYITEALTDLKDAIGSKDTRAVDRIFQDFVRRYPADADTVLRKLIAAGHTQEAAGLRVRVIQGRVL